MNVAVCRMDLRLPESMSLKDKRRVLRSITSRVSAKFSVAIAETDNEDARQHATLGICCVSNDRRHADEVISRVVDFIISNRPDAEIRDYQTEVMSVF